MLNIMIDDREIAASRDGYLNSNLWRSSRVAGDIGWLRDTIYKAANRFWEKQVDSVGGDWLIDDARLDTLMGQVLAAPGYHAGILHGMQLHATQPCADDEKSYIVEMFDGPADDRDFPELTMLAVYRDDTKTLIILWIGLAEDLRYVRERVSRATGGLGNWGPLLAGKQRGWSVRD